MSAIKSKIFSHCTTNVNPHTELQMNHWLADNPDIEIVKMVQSESMVSRDSGLELNLTITLLYRQTADET
jgi:hypothetical protein